MRWSTADVARMSRVSSRTLRHYDHVGLLPPAGTGHGGIRYYERAQLLRLQHILVLRELGLGLDDIAAVLDGGTDEVAALRRHHRRLLAEAARLRTLADTVAGTIEERQEGRQQMAAEELFHGFRADPYAEEARERYGEEAVRAQERVAGWSDDQARGVAEELDAIHRDLAAAMTAGRPVDDPAVQEVVARHHAFVCHFWTPGRDAYIGLGQLYVDDARFTASIDRAGPGLSPYLRDAMAVYAETTLS
jgi:DNA-binding transcriptional MerR regulator